MIIFAIGILIFAFYQFQRDEFLNHSWRWVRREDSPTAFWVIIIGQALMAVVVAILQTRAVYNSN